MAELVFDQKRPDFDLDTASLVEVEEEYAWLRDEILQIDAQLTERQNKFFRKEIPQAEYYDWRSRALGAKNIRIRNIAVVKNRMAQLRREASQEAQGISGERWKRKAFALADALRVLQEMELPPEAEAFVGNTLVRFQAGSLGVQS